MAEEFYGQNFSSEIWDYELVNHSLEFANCKTATTKTKLKVFRMESKLTFHQEN